ncbi:MAG: response regulator transcription factor [Phycisphaerales bacterium]|nr:MAG: response regulator transcription factor [Phycisphaerales bacterium]
MVNKRTRNRSDGAKTRIVVVDDHPVFRQGLADLINEEPDLTVCGEADDANQAVGVIEQLKPDMAIVDITLKETSGLELIKDIRVRHPNLPILTLSMHDESLYAERALRAGAKGYIMKQEATDKVIAAIRRVLGGETYVSEAMAGKMLSKLVGAAPGSESSGVECLSDREFQVFSLIGQGYGTHQIAERLHLSTKTIETYRANVKEKLRLSNAAQLRQYAVQWVASKGSG